MPPSVAALIVRCRLPGSPRSSCDASGGRCAHDSYMPLVALAPIVPRIAASAVIALRLERPNVTLTFDDGPHPEGTPAVLAALDEAPVKAIFFLAGEQAERYPELVGEIARRGHEIGVHCHRHRVQARLRAGEVRADVERALRAIGGRPRSPRPPLGVYSRAGLEIARELGLEPLLWSRWGKD